MGKATAAPTAPPELEDKTLCSIPEAVAQIQQILNTYSGDCQVEFYDDVVKIRNSYKVHSRRDRHRICKIIVSTGLSCRRYDNLSAEWLLHNLAYRLHFMRSSSIDVDLDYKGDPHWIVSLVTWIFDVLSLE